MTALSRSATATAWRRCACRSRSSCRRYRSASAPSVAALAALLYLATHGAPPPFLALFGLPPLPNLMVVVAPYAVSVPLVLMLAERFEPATEAGLIAIVLSPAALVAPAALTAAGVR